MKIIAEGAGSKVEFSFTDAKEFKTAVSYLTGVVFSGTEQQQKKKKEKENKLEGYGDVKECPICGDEYRNNSKTYDQKTCGNECSYKLRGQEVSKSKKKKLTPDEKLSGYGEIKHCPVCHDEFRNTRKHSEQKTCGDKSCLSEHMSKKMKAVHNSEK